MAVKKGVRSGAYPDLTSALQDALENIARGMGTTGKKVIERSLDLMDQADKKQPKKRKSKLDPKPH